MKGAPTTHPCRRQKSSVELLLDTHALFWWAARPRRIPRETYVLIGDTANTVLVSPVSAWEMTSKHRIGKWPEAEIFVANFGRIVRGYGFAELPITCVHAARAGGLDGPSRDPFDRLLAGQALVEDLRFVTADPAFRAFGVSVVWNDAST